MKNYFWKKQFIEFSTILEKKSLQTTEREQILTEQYKKAKDIKLTKIWIYIPFIVLIYLPSLWSRYSVHIKNSIGITLLIVLSWIIFGIDNLVQILALFPIAYGMWYIERIGYKMPFIYDVYSLVFEKILWNIFKLFKKWEKLHKLEKKESFKVDTKKESIKTSEQ